MKTGILTLALVAISSFASANEQTQKVCAQHSRQTVYLDKCRGHLTVDIADGRADQLIIQFSDVKECSKLDITKIGGRNFEGGFDQRLEGNAPFYGTYRIEKSFMVGGTNKIELVVRSNKGYKTGNLDRVAIYVDMKGNQLVPSNNCR